MTTTRIALLVGLGAVAYLVYKQRADASSAKTVAALTDKQYAVQCPTLGPTGMIYDTANQSKLPGYNVSFVF